MGGPTRGQTGNQDPIHALETQASGEALLDPALTQRGFDRVREAARKEHGEILSDLTDQEMSVLALVTEGQMNREIADGLYLGKGTVRNYVGRILNKPNVSVQT